MRCRKLVGIEIAGDPIDLNMTPWRVTSGDIPMGTVTSAVYSPCLERNIGFANVPVELAAPGTGLTVETPNGTAPATVMKTPFVGPAKEIPKS